jgi:hypothetical protein
MRRTLTLLIAAISLMALATGVAAAGPPDHAGGPKKAATEGEQSPVVEFDHPSEAPKVDVCHVNGEGRFHLITVSANSLDAHLGHGDALAGTPVPGLENIEFDEACEQVSTEVVEGVYSDNNLEIGFNAFVAFDDTVTGMAAYSYAIGDRTMDIDVMDVCLNKFIGTATVWGTGDPSWELFVDGYMVLTLVDTGVGSMATRALLFDNEADALAAFASQCETATTGASGGIGYLTFL